MRLLIQGADDAFMEKLLPLLRTPVLVIDLRPREAKTLAWAGDDLPVYHSFDALEGLCDWEDAVYETALDGVEAVYAPPAGAAWPDVQTELPYEDCLILADAPLTFSEDQMLDAKAGVRHAAAVWNQEQGLLQRLLNVFKDQNHE